MENTEDFELIEKHFRKELTPDESARFQERLATDPAFKRKFEAESVVHKALQFSRERESIKAFAMHPTPVATPASQWLDSKTIIMIGSTAVAVWFLSTFSSSLTSLSPEYIKWVGLTVAVVGSMLLLGIRNKAMNPRLATAGLLNGLLVFVIASGIDAINQGAKGIAGKDVTSAQIIPFTGNTPWWPTQSLEDSLEANHKQIQEMRYRIRTIVTSRLNAGPNLNFGGIPGKFMPIVIPRSSEVLSGATYEAEIFLGTTPFRQTIEMRVDGGLIPMVIDPSGMQKGKVSFKASADQFDNTGKATKKFTAEITLRDSTYTKVVEYRVIKPVK